MYLGIDLGTSSVKMLFMNTNGEVIKTYTKEYPISYPQNGWAEQNPEDWWTGVKECFKEASPDLDLKSIEGISFSGQMHGLVILDEYDRVIRPAILWNDQRTQKECDFLNEMKVSNYTGNQALTGFTAPKILWVKNNELENFNKIKKIMLPKDYILYKLSGVHATDVSDASGMLLLNVEKREWSKELIELCQIEQGMLPELYESFEVIGTVHGEVAAELGLSEKTKIIAGGGDQAVGAVGVGAVEEGILSVSLGTSGVVFITTENYFSDNKQRLHSFAHANGKYHQMGVMLSATASLKWWVESVNNSKDYEYFNKLVEECDDNMNELLFAPYLIGERTPHNDGRIRGGFTGIDVTHNRGHMTKAIMEGVGFALKDTLEILYDMGIKASEIRITGGGAKSNVWKKIIANIFNLNVVTVNSTEGPAYGAAILASVGCGRFKSVEEACNNLIKKTETIEPNKEQTTCYEEKFWKYKLLYPNLKKIIDGGVL